MGERLMGTVRHGSGVSPGYQTRAMAASSDLDGSGMWVR